MIELKKYVLSVICAAAICGIINGIPVDGSHSKLLKILCGVFMAITILKPLPGIPKQDVSTYFEKYTIEADIIAKRGISDALQAQKEVIINETEAYILNKASCLNSEIEVQVILEGNEGLIPTSVVIKGDLSAEEKEYLQQSIANELGISKERQVWYGEENTQE